MTVDEYDPEPQNEAYPGHHQLVPATPFSLAHSASNYQPTPLQDLEWLSLMR